MGFKRISYDGNEEIFETVIKDGLGGKLGNWKVMKSDFPSAVKIMFEKYGIPAKVITFDNKKKKTDLDWAMS